MPPAIEEVGRSSGCLDGAGHKDQFNYGAGEIISKQRLAMIGEWFSEILLQLAEAEAKGTAPNWDSVTIPNIADNKEKGRDDHTAFLMLSNTSPHKKSSNAGDQSTDIQGIAADPKPQRDKNMAELIKAYN